MVKKNSKPHTLGVRVSVEHFRAIEHAAKADDIEVSDWVRRQIFRGLRERDDPGVLLTELVGIKLLVSDLLGRLVSGAAPLTNAEVNAIMEQVKKLKSDEAHKLLAADKARKTATEK